MKTKYWMLVSAALLIAGTAFAQDLPTAGSTSVALPAAAPTMMTQSPLSQDDVLLALKKKTPAEDIIKDLKNRGADFEIDAEIEKKLRKAKATDELIKAVKDAGPKARAEASRAAAIASGAAPFSADELNDLKAINSEPDPDKAIALIDETLKKHPDNKDFQSYAYVFGAYAFEKKNDGEKALEYAQKSVDLKPDNLLALLTEIHIIPQPRYINHHQAEEDKKLTLAMNYSKDAEKAVGELKKQKDETDESFATRKSDYVCSIHSDRGMIHLDLAQEGLLSTDRDELAKAVVDYKAAVTCANPMSEDYYRLGDSYRLLGKTDEAIDAYTKASQLGQGIIRQYADQQLAALKAAKAAAPAAKP